MKRFLPDTRGLPRTFWILCGGLLVNRLGGFVAPFLAIYLTTVRRMPVAEVGLIVALVGLGSIASGPVGGILADRIGRRSALLIGTSMGGSAMLGLGFSRTPALIAAMAFVLGFCADLYRPVMGAIVADVVPSEDRQRAYGFLHWVVNVGFAVSIVIAGFLAQRNFTALFVGDAITTFAFGLVVWANVPETRPERSKASKKDRFELLRPYRDAAFLSFFALSLLNCLVFLQGFVTLPISMRSHGVSSEQYGLLMAINGGLIVLLQPFAAPFVTRFQRRHVLSASAALIAVAFGMNGLIPGSIPMYAASIVIWTFGEIAAAPVTPSVVADLAPPELRGSYQGAFQMTWGAGSFLAPVIGSYVLSVAGESGLWAGCTLIGFIAAAGFLVTPLRAAPVAVAET